MCGVFLSRKSHSETWQHYLDGKHNPESLTGPRSAGFTVFGDAAFAPATCVLFWSVALNSKSCSPSRLGNDSGHLLSPFCPAPAVWRCCHAVFANNTNLSKWQNSRTHMRGSLMSSSPSLGSCAPRVMQEAYQQLSHQVKLSCREVGNPHPSQQTRLESWGCGRGCSLLETESRKY